MQVPLSSIATVQSGIVLSRKETTSDSNAIKYQRLSLRALNSSGHVEHSELEVFMSRAPIQMTHRTNTGDIIIRLFSPLFPTLIAESDAGFVIPSQLAVVRLQSDAPMLPAYLQYCRYILHGRKRFAALNYCKNDIHSQHSYHTY